MRITVVVGARPNFMKAAPVLAALREGGRAAMSLVHTGQHYDERMSGQFLQELDMPRPDVDLGVGSGSHGQQTGQVLARFEEYLVRSPRDLVVVVGDVNSTLAAALAAVKLHVPVAHVEAGLRSRDRRMPEEINRILTDAMAALLFVTEPAGVENLRAEGIEERRIHLVGNTMIDTLLRFRAHAADREVLRTAPEAYALVTLHRPSNVDDAATLSGILGAFEAVAGDCPLVWPVHPRTRARLQEFGLWEKARAGGRVLLWEPCGYLDFLALMTRARLILTDSGGIQEEALVLRVPVVTMRENTERPITVECGGNVLSGPDPERILRGAREMLGRDRTSFRVPELWDGKAGERAARVIRGFLEGGAWL